MSRLWAVVRREYLERVRSKAFLIGTVVGPLLLAGLSFGPALIMSRQQPKALRLAVLDETGGLGAELERALAERRENGRPRFDLYPLPAGERASLQEQLKGQVRAGQLDAFVVLPNDTLSGGNAQYWAKNLSNFTDPQLLERLLDRSMRAYRLRASGVPPEQIADLNRGVELKKFPVSEHGSREDKGASFLLSFTLLMALYMSTAMWGTALMNGVIEEKVNRVVEVVVSSVPASSLFAGKLLGVGGVGLTQILVWAAFAFGLSLVGAQGAAISGIALPEVPAALLAYFVLFFLLGFFLYGALYMAIGAAVNSQQEAQSLVFPVMLPLVTAVMFFPAVLNSPDSTLSTVASLVPCWTPLLMFLRLSAVPPPAWQVGLSVVLTIATIVLLTRFAARVYRVGILMYGKRPTLPEILRWVRRP